MEYPLFSVGKQQPVMDNYQPVFILLVEISVSFVLGLRVNTDACT